MTDEQQPAAKVELKVKQDGGNFYAVNKATEEIVSDPFPTRNQAKKFIKAYDAKEGITDDPEAADDDTDQEAEGKIVAEEELDDELGEDGAEPLSLTGSASEVPDAPTQAPKAEPKTEHNPFGLDIHERFHRLVMTLSRMGIKHTETAHPNQNATTTPEKFARRPADGQNALPTAEKTSTLEADATEKGEALTDPDVSDPAKTGEGK